ncbi:MAG: TraR/DksA C4-type zinc finger protein, partial [Acidimicrobiales bacterium]
RERTTYHMAPTTKAAAKAAKAPAKKAKKSASKAGTKKKAPAAAKKNAPATKRPAKKSSAKKSSAKKTPAKKAPSKQKTTAAKKARAKKAPAKKAPAKKAMAKTAPAKKAPAKQAAPAKKAPAKKGPAKQAAAIEKAPVKAALPKQPSAASRSRGGIPALGKRMPNEHDRKAPPKRTGPLDKFLLGQLASLNEERITYERQAASLKAEADLLVAEREPGDVQFDEESGEGDTLAVERERDLVLSASASAAVEDIDRAIEKLNDGTYGVCEQCYAKIPKERLRALPYAALCVQCKSAGFSRR